MGGIVSVAARRRIRRRRARGLQVTQAAVDQALDQHRAQHHGAAHPAAHGQRLVQHPPHPQDAEHAFSGVVSSEPVSPEQHWHIDSPHEATEHLPAHAINVLIALTDLPLAMGPTEFACGSHLLTNHLANPTLVSDQLVYQHAETSPVLLVNGTCKATPEYCSSTMSEGSCLIFDDRILHRGMANRSGSTRRIAYFSYRRKDYLPYTHFESPRSVFDA